MSPLECIITSESVTTLVKKLKKMANENKIITLTAEKNVIADSEIIINQEEIYKARADFEIERHKREGVLREVTGMVVGELLPKIDIDVHWVVISKCNVCDKERKRMVPAKHLNDKILSMSDEKRSVMYAPLCINCSEKTIPLRSFFRYEPKNKERIIEITSRVKTLADKLTDMILGVEYEKEGSIPTKIKAVQDTYGLRVITTKESICYDVLESFEKIIKIDQIKDYIQQPKRVIDPKSNKVDFYQSIHVIGIYNDTLIEGQIRTSEMHKHCEDEASIIYHKARNERKTEKRRNTPLWCSYNSVIREIFNP